MCVRPSHLVVTSQRWNIGDREAKGRGNGGRRRSEKDTTEIFSMIDSGMSQREIAQKLGVSQPAICYWAKKRRAAND